MTFLLLNIAILVGNFAIMKIVLMAKEETESVMRKALNKDLTKEEEYERD